MDCCELCHHPPERGTRRVDASVMHGGMGMVWASRQVCTECENRLRAVWLALLGYTQDPKTGQKMPLAHRVETPQS